MNINLLLQAASLIFVFLSLLFALFLFSVKSKNRTGNILLGIYFIISAIDVSSFFYHNYFELLPTIEMLRIEFGSFLKKPFLFLFVLSIIYSDFRIKLKHLLHLIPLLISTIVLFPRFYLSNNIGKISFFEDHVHTFEGSFSTVLSHLQTLFYIIAVFILLWQYRNIILENYSISDRFNYTWLLQLNLFLSGLLVLALVKSIYKFGDFGEGLIKYRLGMALAHLTFICWLFLKALYAPKIFTGIESKLQLVSTTLTDSEDNYISKEKRKVDGEELRQVAALKEYLIQHEPYVDPTLTIMDLASQLDMDVRSLSLLINRTLKQNFYNFINNYRINKAKEILKDPEKRKLTILEVLYQVGFNSKSSFNTSFKKNTGLTPTRYRKNHS